MTGRAIAGFAAVLAVAVAAAGCAAPTRTSELERIDLRHGYRARTLDAVQPDPLPHSYLAVTFSGGGMRAAALALGALRGLERTVVTEDGREVRLVDAIDIVSSVSGGSVTAAHFALHGTAGFDRLDRGFLRRDVEGALILTALNPVTWVRLATPSYARIDALADYFDDEVFDGQTYDALLGAAESGPGRRPYTVLNAADMESGSVFSFTQDQFDLICSDLRALKLSDAVAASAALTALSLRNHAPCRAQRDAPGNPFSGWERVDGRALPSRLVQATDPRNIALNPGRYRLGRRALGYLNGSGARANLHLLDGGIADNLGLTLPLALLSDPGLPDSARGAINRGDIVRAAFVVVNARSDATKDIGREPTPPGVVTTLSTTIGSPIDGSSFLLLDQLQESFAREAAVSDLAFATHVVLVDFDFILDAECRQQFKNIATSWALPDREIDALLELGQAMVEGSAAFQALVRSLGGRVQPAATVERACAVLAPAGG